jgi:hypothetical protein
VAVPTGQALEALVRDEQRGPAGLSFDQLAANAPPPPTPTYGRAKVLAAVIRSELAAGRVSFDGSRYVLRRERFPHDLLAALERLALPD